VTGVRGDAGQDLGTVEFVRALPKAELHLHLEGAVPWAMVRSRSPELLPERPPWWAEDFRFDGFDRFREAARTCLAGLTDLAACTAAAADIFLDLKGQNVRYVEISFDVVRMAGRAWSLADLVAAIRGVAPQGLMVRVFGGFSYHKVDRTPRELIEEVLTASGVDGIDLHGDETRQSTGHFAAAFAEARRRGLLTKAHAGELAGPESIVRALDLLGVTRLGHDVRAIEDEAVLARLGAESVTLDLCPWSNVKLRVAPDRLAHPIRQLHRRGLRVTVSTDDPTVFGRSLSEEIASLVSDHHFTLADVARLQANAFEVAQMPAAQRAGILAEIEVLAARRPESFTGARRLGPAAGPPGECK
jgi:adenosine deaminase